MPYGRKKSENSARLKKSEIEQQQPQSPLVKEAVQQEHITFGN
jgi:hypothetical protein